MAVYRDSAEWCRGGVLSGHLVADTLDELHDFAARLRLTPTHFQRHALTPHYTLPEALHGAADALGARALERRAFSALIARLNAGRDPEPPPRTRTKRAASRRDRSTPARSRPDRTPRQPALL